MEINERIKEARLAKSLTQEAVANHLGISKQAVSQFEKGVTQPRPHILKKLADLLDADFTSKVKPTLPPPSNAFAETIIEEKDEDSNFKFIDQGDGQYIMIIPWIQEYGYAGYSRGFKDPEYVEGMPTQRLIVNKQHRGAYRAITVLGDSMENYTNVDKARESIPEGSIAFGREIQRHLWRDKFHLHRFKDYIIVHKSGIQIKRIIKHNVAEGIITCHSLNPDKEEYPDFDLYLDDCNQIFNIVSVQTTR
jgi:transcriptional regulator with XRE-family HTH domain